MLTLGIDLSTQGVKAVAWDVEDEKVVFSASVNYGKDLPQYGSPDGFLPNADVLVRHADPRMWVEGLELVLKRLQESGCPMGDVGAIGGDAQQHATVFLSEEGLKGLKSLKGLEGLESWFSRKASPIWMDSSTGAECAALDAKFGARLQTDTGSPAIERFAGPQIMKFAKEEPEAYAKTKRIHLLSSFLASYLVGEDMPIDTGDGAGMNLLNLKTGEWDAEICAFVAPGLVEKLPNVVGRTGGTPVPLVEKMSCPFGKQPHSRVERASCPFGVSKPLSARFAKFGLMPGIPVVPFTGDNPASLVGCFAERPGTAVISLGTSDVFFAAMDSFHTDPDGYGHVFGNPMGGFMSLSCFKNGSLARDRVRREIGVDWKFFDETAWEGLNGRDARSTRETNGRDARSTRETNGQDARSTRTANGQDVTRGGEVCGTGVSPVRAGAPLRAFPYFEAEITPKHAATGIEANFDWNAADAATKVRAIVEGQIANMYERTRWIGDFDEIKVTGGASRSKGIRETIARIFKAKVTTLDVTDSAAVGGARLAARAASRVLSDE